MKRYIYIYKQNEKKLLKNNNTNITNYKTK